MKLAFKVDGEHVIPLRALPFVAGFKPYLNEPNLPPSLVALAATSPEAPGIQNTIPLYRFACNGKAERLRTEIHAQIFPLELLQPEDDAPLFESVKRLPSGVFVRLEDAYRFLCWLFPDGVSLTGGDFQEWNPDLQLSDEFARLVFEGFDEEYGGAEKHSMADAFSSSHPNQASATHENGFLLPTQADDCHETDWTHLAREIADGLHEKDTKCGAFSSLRDIAERVQVEMRTRQFHGPRGPLSSATILREALQGGRWIRKKQPG